MTCIRVEEYDTYYRCFMKADDGSKAVQKSLFAENDQAQCRDINVKEGIYDNVSNQYYWRLVVGVGDDYIDLSKDDCDTGVLFRLLVTISANLGTVYIKRGKMLLLSLPMVLILLI